MRQLTPAEIADEAIGMFLERLSDSGAQYTVPSERVLVMTARAESVQEVQEGCAVKEENVIPAPSEDTSEAIKFLYDSARQVGYREGEDEGRRAECRYVAKNNHKVAAMALEVACKTRYEETRRELAKIARMVLYRTPMISPHIHGISSRLDSCNLNDSSKMVLLGVLEAARDLATQAARELS